MENFNFVKKMSAYFKAMSDPKRLMIVRMLTSNMENKICVSKLAKMLNITQPSTYQDTKKHRSP